MKVLVGVFNQEKALVGAFFVIDDCENRWIVCSTTCFTFPVWTLVLPTSPLTHGAGLACCQLEHSVTTITRQSCQLQVFCNIKFLSDIWFSKNYTLATGWGLVFVANILSTIKIRLILNIINQSIKIPLKLSFKTPIKLTFVHISHFVVLLDAEHKSNSILIACPKQCQPRANSVRKAMTIW